MTILSLEDRLLVALSARGSQRIGQFLDQFLDIDHPLALGEWMRSVSDEEFVSALEAAVDSAKETNHG